MALHDTIRNKIVPQEIQIIEQGQHFGTYSAKVKYSPENIISPEFFSLCYGRFRKYDRITVILDIENRDTPVSQIFEFIVTSVNLADKSITTVLLTHIDLLSMATELTENPVRKETDTNENESQSANEEQQNSGLKETGVTRETDTKKEFEGDVSDIGGATEESATEEQEVNKGTFLNGLLGNTGRV